MGIVIFGATFVDIKGHPFSQYIPGGRNAGRITQVHGGVSRNVAEDVANIGLNPTFVTVLDHSGISSDVISKLNSQGVETKYIYRTDDGLGTWMAVFDNQGDVIASISMRPNLSGILHILEEYGDEIISQADSVVIEFDMEEEILDEIFHLAEKYHKEIYAVISNMSIALQRRNLIQKLNCIVCNQQEAGMLFSEEYDNISPDELLVILKKRVEQAGIKKMVVTMGGDGAVYMDGNGEGGFCPAQKVDVIDTTGCGDSFFAGIAVGLTYGKTLQESAVIGTRLASSVIATKENVCPRFRPEEFDLVIPKQ